MRAELSREREGVKGWRGAVQFAGSVYHSMRSDFYKYHRNGKLTPKLRYVAKADPRFMANIDTKSGRRLLWRTFEEYDRYYASIPNQCLAMLHIVTQKFTHRRKDTLRNILFVAEAIVHRAAYQHETQVLFSFDSIKTWVKHAEGVNLGYRTVRTALEYLNDSEFFEVKFGTKGVLTRCTVIKLLLNPHDTAGIQETYDWLAERDWVLNEVFGREESRQAERELQSLEAERLLHDTGVTL